MALSDHHEFFTWAGAAAMVYAMANIGACKGWLLRDGYLQKSLTFIALLFCQKAVVPEIVVYLAAPDLRIQFFYFWLPIVALGVFSVALMEVVLRSGWQTGREARRE
ncbi:hypothetical protein ACP4OV_005498 [Aristida adscensionis]